MITVVYLSAKAKPEAEDVVDLENGIFRFTIPPTSGSPTGQRSDRSSNRERGRSDSLRDRDRLGLNREDRERYRGHRDDCCDRCCCEEDRYSRRDYRGRDSSFEISTDQIMELLKKLEASAVMCIYQDRIVYVQDSSLTREDHSKKLLDANSKYISSLPMVFLTIGK